MDLEAARREILCLRSQNAQLARQNTECMNQVYAGIAEANEWKQQALTLEAALVDMRREYDDFAATVTLDAL